MRPNGWGRYRALEASLAQPATLSVAIASDVHGKNHHPHGYFSECFDSIEILLATGQLERCSRTEQADLLHATSGGMGFTGLIVGARMHLRRVESAYIKPSICGPIRQA